MKRWERILMDVFMVILFAFVLVLVCRPALAAIRCFPILTEEKQPDGSKIFRSREKKCYYVEDPLPSPTPPPVCTDHSCPR